MAKHNKKSLSSGSGFRTKEAYKSLRTNIQFLLVNEKSNVVVFTSANVGEGKSTTTVNTAITMAEAGARILIIDADLRRPVIHKMMKMTLTPGLTNLFSGRCSIKDVIRPSNYPRIDICTGGALPPNPAELLGSEQMSKFLEIVSQKYDYVFIDTPPINAVTDSLVLTKQVAGYIYVIRQGLTDTDSLARAIQSAEFVDAKILGIVLNDVKNSISGGKVKYGKYSDKYSYDNYYNYYASNDDRLNSTPEITPVDTPKSE